MTTQTNAEMIARVRKWKAEHDDSRDVFERIAYGSKLQYEAPALADALEASLEREAGLRTALENVAEYASCAMTCDACAGAEPSLDQIHTEATRALAPLSAPTQPETKEQP